jgi:hypothetical protein
MKIITKNIKESLAEKFPFIRKLRFYHYITIWLLLTLIPYIIFYIYTFPLRSKESYSRNVVVDFIYKGESYKISANAKCVNHGVASSLVETHWHTEWGHSVENNEIKLSDGVKAVLRFNPSFDGELCRNKKLLTLDQEELKSLMKKHKDSLVKFWLKNLSKDQIGDMFLKDKKYANIDFDLITISDANEFESNNTFKALDVRVTSLFFGEKKLIRSYKKYLPFFLDHNFYHKNGLLALLVIALWLTIVPPLLLLLIISPIITLFLNLVSGLTNFFINLFK